MKKKEFAKVQKQINDKMNKYADKIIIGQYTGEKEPQRKEGEFWKDRDGKQWTLKGAWIQAANFNDLDFSSSDPVDISVTLRYDYAILEF